MKCKIAATGLLIVLSVSAVMQPAILGQAAGQPQFGTWEAVKAIPSGDKVEIKLKSGKTVKGEVASVSDSAIIVGRGSKSVTTTRDDVKRLSRIIKKSSRKPVLVGALVGAGLIGGGTAIAAAAAVYDALIPPQYLLTRYANMCYSCNSIGCGRMDV